MIEEEGGEDGSPAAAVVSVELEEGRRGQEGDDYRRIARVAEMMERHGFRGDGRFLGPQGELRREGKRSPGQGSYVRIGTTDTTTRRGSEAVCGRTRTTKG